MLYYAIAGHHALPLIVRENEEVIELHEMDIAVGFLDDFPYKDREINLQKNDWLLLHTDGIIEMTDKDEKLFGMDRLKSFLQMNYKTNSQDVLINLVREGTQFSKKLEQEDDIALMLIEIH